MSKCLAEKALLGFALTAFGLTEMASAGTLYSNLQGDYVSEQTSSHQVYKGTNTASGPVNIDYGATGFGDDYSADPNAPTATVNGVPSVLLSGITFYGNVTPTGGTPAESLGTTVAVNFFTSAGVFYQRSVSITTAFQGGMGLHAFTFEPAYVPANGYIIFSPSLYATNGGFGTTPLSTGDLTLTGYFGGAPTVGSASGAGYASTDTNRNLSITPANAGSPAFLQMALIGDLGAAAPVYFTGAQGNVLTASAGNFATASGGSTAAAQVPGAGIDVIFGATSNATTTNFNTTLGGDLAVNSLTFTTNVRTPVPFTIGGTNTLTLNGGNVAYAGNVGIMMHALAASTTINAKVAVGGSQGWTNDAAAPLTVNGTVALGGNRVTLAGSGPVTISGAIGGTGGLTNAGTGVHLLSGANTYSGATVVQSGTLRATAPAYTNLLANTGGVDLVGGRLLLDYAGGTSPAGQVQAILSAGYPNFSAGQIRSTTLALGQTIGFGDNGSTVTLRITLPGDANLDGAVDFNDFLVLQNNFGHTGTRFDEGDFNYDGTSDFNDFLALQNNFGQSVGSKAAIVTAAEYAAVMAITASSSVPEPAGAALIGLTATGLLRVRRRRRTSAPAITPHREGLNSIR